MTDVSIIGLGAMGAALAQKQIDSGFAVCVWNRTAAKSDPLVANGALVAETAADAFLSSPVTLVCVDSYTVTSEVLVPLDAVDLTGRTLVQFSTGTPREAREAADWAASRGSSYLDGAIMCYPDSLGAADSPILIGGSEPAFKAAEAHLQPLGDVQYLGDNVASAPAIDMGLLTMSVSLYAGVAQAARICEAEGADLGRLAALADHEGSARKRLEVIDADAFQLNSLHSGASLSVWTNVVQRLATQSDDAGIDRRLPTALLEIYREAVDLGHGAEDVTALIKALRVH